MVHILDSGAWQAHSQEEAVAFEMQALCLFRQCSVGS